MSTATTTSTVVTVADIDVSYHKASNPVGDADTPVVLIHGLAEDKSSWLATQEALDDVTTYAYDLRGHGQSTVGEADGTLAQLANDLVGFLEAVTGPAVLVGFSLGGTIALQVAADRPDLVRRLVVLGTSSVVGRSAVDFYAQRIEQAQDTSTAEFASAIRDDTAAALVTTDRLDEITAARLRAIGEGGGYRNAARAMAALNGAPLTDTLADIGMHVDVIGADNDAFCPMKAAQILLDGLPDATYREIPRAGHLMNVDNPEAVASALRSTVTGRK
ncbi:MAG: alpha/beta hydrolase [Gordonia sp. (in: high G+C Gram-positive bacteria)]|uniref:alpha/beta fold hydrolase n=1 Tax=Gordonia TaxID=2053 RepID=UPI003266EC08